MRTTVLALAAAGAPAPTPLTLRGAGPDETVIEHTSGNGLWVSGSSDSLPDLGRGIYATAGGGTITDVRISGPDTGLGG